MTPTEISIAGRITALEFLMEIILSNDISGWSKAESDRFKAGLLNVGPSQLAKGPVDVEILQAIDAEFRASIAAFVRKISEREKEIRG